MAYDLAQFIADCRANLARDPGPAGREQVRVDLKQLLKNEDFIRQHCGDDKPHGVSVLYEDPALGPVFPHDFHFSASGGLSLEGLGQRAL